MTFKDWFLQTFTWWSSQTTGTRFALWWNKGELVGEDEFGNRYFRFKSHVIDPSVGAERRWVVYNGVADASKIPPGWRGWMTHTTDVPPTEETYVKRPWEQPHLENQTGTPNAYRPRGSLQSAGQRPAATGDYIAWTPNE
ncbi:MAG TPA: NADH:ubiquinone oxidoreductase subunit NDUFA12 [Beijerinckiaceae bacterium]|jgi:NADH:ubiquinone oxidoreductase subunit